MERSESISKLAAALVKVQAEMTAVPMNATNPFFKSKYADLGSVINTARPILAKYGLAVSQMPTSDAGAVGVETVLMHESGEYISNRVTITATAKAQEAGSTITYLRRYSYAAILGMHADEDDDGGSGEKKKGEEKSGLITTAKIVTLKLADNVPNATKLIELLKIAGWEEKAALNKIGIYRVWRTTGKLDPAAAAEKTNNGEVYSSEQAGS